MRKPIPGYETLYAVDEDGSIWRVGAPRGRPLNPGLRNGYPFVRLSAGNVQKSFSVHYLVLLTFEGPPADNEEARHLNGVKTDNRRANLAWSTHAVNMEDRNPHGTMARGEKQGQAKLTEEAVLHIKSSGFTAKELASLYRVSKSTIEAVRTGRNWKHVVTH
jgi:HNH endonuclease